MVDTASLAAIRGTPVDPPPKHLPEQVRSLESKKGIVGAGASLALRTSTRFTVSRVTLLAAGTTYYLFLALFSILTLAYGLTAALGAEQLSDYITEAVSSAFPGLIGQTGIDPEALRSTAQVTSIVSAVSLLYGATGAVMGASRSLHAVYGAPNNTRNFVMVRFWAVGWFLLFGPLILLSYISGSVTTNLFDKLLSALGLRWSGPTPLLDLSALALTLVLNFIVVRLMLARLGGIRPPRTPLLVGAAVGAIAIEVLKQAMALLVGFVIDKPQYGALAAPIGIMFVLYMQAMALYGVASLTAGMAESPVHAPEPGSPGVGGLLTR